MAAPVLVGFRRDLRLADHPALQAALATGAPVIPVYVDERDGDWPPGAASRWWLHHSLAALDADLRARGSRLLLRRGPLDLALATLQEETGASAVFVSRRVEPAAREAEQRLREALAGRAELRRFAGDGLHPPDRLRTTSGGPYRVFTPFWKALAALPAPEGLSPAPDVLPVPARWPSSLALDELAALPRIDWAAGLRAAWTPGEAGAQAALARFVADAAADYPDGREVPGRPGVSRLSPHLHFGEIAPARLWAAMGRVRPAASAEAWRRQLAWRDFARHLLLHFPATRAEPLDARFQRFPWRDDPAALAAWQRGETGYPLVDAGMRELWTTGWMHGRVRMVTASFLAKHLLIDWREGARWFWDTLVDADLANNTLGWQWTAGCGADAAPYFRVFNPAAQARRFDADGAYIRRWVPELSVLPDRWLAEPWTAPAGTLRAAGITLGRDYPAPIVEHAAARRRALDAWKRLSGKGESA